MDKLDCNVYVFGNSPKCNIEKTLREGDKAVALGHGINYLKHTQFEYWFTRPNNYDTKLTKDVKNVFILSSKQNNKEKNITYITNEQSKAALSFIGVTAIPSLGLFSIAYLLTLYKKVFVSGITLDIKDTNINGCFWNLKERRFNSFHNLVEEIGILNKLKRQQLLYEF